MSSITETITALATPPGKGGVGIVRVSGTDAKRVAQTMLGFIPQPRVATFCSFKQKDEVIDEGIAIYFPAPHSFTGEDVLEFQGHGGPIVLDRLIKTILQFDVRMARAGEFSERAFLNNKLDLAQAEAIADLINADSEQAAKSAMRSLQGEFSKKINQFIHELIEIRKMVEAAIDFPDEEIDFLTEGDVATRLIRLIEQLKQVLSTAKQGALLQEGMTVVIAGEPNAGKSSLLNCLSGKDSAIVTDVAGTTRDILREHIHIDGMPLHIIDTAGLRESDDVVEQEGVRRAKAAIEQADMVLLMVDASKPHTLSDEIAKMAQHVNLPELLPLVVVGNKADLLNEKPSKQLIDNTPVIKLSAKYQQGIDLLTEHLKQHMGFHQSPEGVFTARRRHVQALANALQWIEQGSEKLTEHRASELLAEDLRLAQQALTEITGEYSSDDLLGEIFSSFCIGK